MRFSPAFFVGIGAHVGLAAYYNALRQGTRGGVWIDPAVRTAISAWARDARDTFEQTFPLQRWEEVGADDLVAQIGAMVENYQAFDRLHPIHGTVVAVEERITAEILTHEGFASGHALTGQLDLVVEHEGGVEIWDHKTFSARTLADDPAQGLDVDEQLTAYAYLWWRKTGQVPSQIGYNVLVKEVPEPPELLKSGALSKNKGARTTPSMYRDAIEQHGLNINDYLDHLAWLDAQDPWARYFARWSATRNIHELRAFERRLYTKLQDVIRIVDDPATFAYPSGRAYGGSRCGWCPFLALCKSIDDGGDYEALLTQYREKTLWSLDH